MAYTETYTPTAWENSPAQTTPINAENLDNIERGIKTLDSRTVEMSEQADAMALVYRAQAIIYGATEEAEANSAAYQGTINFGGENETSGNNTVAFGSLTKASAVNALAMGEQTTASGGASHSEGGYSKAEGDYSHAEGVSTEALGYYSHTEGERTKTLSSGQGAHAEGNSTTAGGPYSHAEGIQTQTLTSSTGAHAEGLGTVADGQFQHVQGRYNEVDSSGQYAHIVGAGNGDSDRKNIHTLDWQGNAAYAGNVTSGSGNSIDGLNEKIDSTVKVPELPATGTYILKCIGGVLSWAEDN